MYKRLFTIVALSLLASGSLADKSPADGNATVKGSLPKDVIRGVIKQHIGEVKQCYETELTKNQNLAGKVMVRFTIGFDGKVTDSSITETTLKSPAAEKCIADAVLRWEFPRPSGDKVVVSYPFVLASVEPAGAGGGK